MTLLVHMKFCESVQGFSALQGVNKLAQNRSPHDVAMRPFLPRHVQAVDAKSHNIVQPTNSGSTWGTLMSPTGQICCDHMQCGPRH